MLKFLALTNNKLHWTKTLSSLIVLSIKIAMMLLFLFILSQPFNCLLVDDGLPVSEVVHRGKDPDRHGDGKYTCTCIVETHCYMTTRLAESC